MKIFALADLHLSLDKPYRSEDETTFSGTKPMDIFGTRWDQHIRRIDENWRNTVGEKDIVLIAGDISWAMTLEEACFDLDFVASLPGKKIMIRGNHDFWWHSPKKIRASLDDSISIIQNDAVLLDDIAICGTRLWTLPSSNDFKSDDEVIFRRELIRQELSLQAAGGRPVINMTHFMPVDSGETANEVVELFKKYNVVKSVYGHLHDKSHAIAVQGEKHGMEFYLTSADYLGFTPRLIAEI